MADLREMIQALTPAVPLPEGLNTATGTVGIDAAGDVLVYQPPDVIEYAGPGGPFLPLSGGQLTGPLLLAGPPVQPMEAASKAYVDTAVGAQAPVATGSITPRSLPDRFADVVDVRDFGGIFDGTSHPLSQYYASLAAAQAVYPFATALSDEIDGVATQAAINLCQSRVVNFAGGGTVRLPCGTGLVNRPLVISACNVSLVSEGAGIMSGATNFQRFYASAPTTLLWTGAVVAPGTPQSVVLTVAPIPSPATGRRLTGCNVEGILVNCQTIAGTCGFVFASTNYATVDVGTFEPAGVAYAGAQLTSGSQTITLSSTAGLRIGESVVSASLPAGCYVARILSPSQFNASMQALATSTETVTIGGEGIRFDVVDELQDVNDTQELHVSFSGYALAGAANATAPLVLIGGSSVIGGGFSGGNYGNTSACYFDFLNCTYNNGNGVVLNNSDHNVHGWLSGVNIGGGGGRLLISNGSLDPNNGGSRLHFFGYVSDAGLHTGLGYAGLTEASQGHIVNWADRGNAARLPTFLGTGCSINLNADSQRTAAYLGGTQAVLAQFPDTTVMGGNLRGLNAVDLQTSRAAATQVASGAQSVLAGGQNNTVLSPFAVVAGGQNNIAGPNGNAPVVAGGQNNTANNGGAFVGGGNNNQVTGSNSVVVGGQGNTASGIQSVVGGGINNVAGGNQATIAGGSTNNASALMATAVGGFLNQATQPYTTAMGYIARADLYGAVAMSSNPISGTRAAQKQIQILSGVSTPDTTPLRLTADQLAAGAVNVCNLTYGTQAMALSVHLIASDASGANNRVAWTQPLGLIRRNGGVGSTVYVPSSTTAALTEGTTAGYAVTESADLVNGGYNLTFTPPTGNTVPWRVVATVEMTRVDSQ